MIKNIVFDCSDTLLHFSSQEELSKLTGNSTQAAQIKSKIHQSRAWNFYDKGLMTEEGLRQEILPLFTEMERPFAAWYLDNWSKCYSPIPGMYDLVAELREKNWPLYIISDFPPRFDELKAFFSDLFCAFNGIDVSCECQLTKADKGLFSHFLQTFHCDATECLFIDDIPRNVENARSLGFHGIVFESAHSLSKHLSELNIL